MNRSTAVKPSREDMELARSAIKIIDSSASDDVHSLTLTLNDGHSYANKIPVPDGALPALSTILDSFARGQAVTVIPAQAEVSTGQAADALNVSRPYLIGLLDSGEIAYRKVGTHRRVDANSLIHYMRRDDQRRNAAADALAAETHELGFASCL